MAKIPQWALKYKTKGTEIRYINGHYYLYKITSKWDPKKKRPVKVTLGLLGKITEQGFVESEKRILERNAKVNEQQLIIKEYGLSSYIENELSNYIELLKKHFPQHWKFILSVGYLRLGYQSVIKNYQYHYQRSFLSEKYGRIGMSIGSVSKKLREIGSQRQAIVDFFKEFRQLGEHIVFDGTDLFSESKQMRYPSHSRSKKGTYENLANVMFIFSSSQQLPIYYRLYPGSVKDVRAFGQSLAEAGIEDGIVIADKGFYSQTNIERIEAQSLRYIIPLRRNSKLIDYGPISEGSRRAFDGFFRYEGKIIWYYQKRDKSGRRVIVYLNEQLKSQEISDYLQRCEDLPEEYNIDNFYQKEHSFGTLSVITNLAQNHSAEEIYKIYKSRGQIEQMFDSFKNLFEADRSYMQNDEALEGWMFINYLVMHWYYHIYLKLKEQNLIKKYSVKDIIKFLVDIKKVKINNDWYLDALSKKNKQLLEKLVHIP